MKPIFVKIMPSPLFDFARSLEIVPPYALLHSGMSNGAQGRYSYLAYDASEVIQADDFDALDAALKADPEGWWCGYCGYGLKNSLESLTEDPPTPIAMPNLWMVKYETVLRYDHQHERLEAIKGAIPDLPKAPASLSFTPLVRNNASQSFDQETYHTIIRNTVDAIHAGDFYEANITQKYWGELADTPDILSTFHHLTAQAQTPYSALLHLDHETAILSASPECFLTADTHGIITSRPIKGSAKRSALDAEDQQHRDALAQSEKNRAENLMIVDLIRNDFGRVCEPGSVAVDHLYTIESFETIHHMVSSISGQLKANASTLDAVKASFPPGSMTGAPKIAAMEWCSKQEPYARGVYSGALGWIAGDGSADLSVVIRTLILKGRQYEYQMGGAIVADSDPEDEWHEMRLKAQTVESLFD